MLTYNEARKLFNRARDKTKGAVIKGKKATRLIKWGNFYGIQYHNTVVVLINFDDTYSLFTGGWHTNTTKARIHQYSPANLSIRKGKVYLLDTNYKIVSEFKEGMTVNNKGNLINE